MCLGKKGKTLWVILPVAILLFSYSLGEAAPKVQISVFFRSLVPEEKWMKGLKAEFEKENPQIEIKFVQAPAGTGFYEKLTLLYAAGNPPDIVYATHEVQRIIRNGWVRDLTSFVNRDFSDEEKADFLGPALKIWVDKKGRQLGLPVTANGQGIFYNREHLDEAGLIPPPTNWDSDTWTWNDMVQYAKKLTRLNPDGTAQRFGIAAIPIEEYISWLFGGEWFPGVHPFDVPQEIKLLTPENIKAFQALIDLHLLHKACPGPLIPWAKSPTGNVFTQGLVSMMKDGWWVTRDYVPNPPGFEWGIAAVPKVVSRQHGIASNPLFVTAASKHPEEAWRFVKFALSPLGLEIFMNNYANVPPRASAAKPFFKLLSHASGMNEKEVFESYVGSLKYGRLAVSSIEINALVVQGLSLALRGQESVENALAKIEKTVNARLKNF